MSLKRFELDDASHSAKMAAHMVDLHRRSHGHSHRDHHQQGQSRRAVLTLFACTRSKSMSKKAIGWGGIK
jgi:hypothetical protein